MDPSARLTPLTSKLKEFSLNIPEDSTWADDANEEANEEVEMEVEEPLASCNKRLSDCIPTGNIRLPTSRKRSRRALPTPTPDDSLDTIDYKLREIALAVQAGENAALITDYSLGIPQVRGPIEQAKQSMKLLEREQYDAWEASQTIMVDFNEFNNLTPNGSDNNANNTITNFPPPRKQFTLPEINWETDTHPLPEGKHSIKKFSKRASALAVAYSLRDSSICTPEHAVYFTYNHPTYLPLLYALIKVEAAHRNLTGDAETLSSMDLAEVQVMRTVNAIASQKVGEKYKELKDVAGRIARSQRVLRERENEIKAGVEGYRVKDYGGVGTKMR
jgi:hypothetical protein